MQRQIEMVTREMRANGDRLDTGRYIEADGYSDRGDALSFGAGKFSDMPPLRRTKLLAGYSRGKICIGFMFIVGLVLLITGLSMRGSKADGDDGQKAIADQQALTNATILDQASTENTVATTEQNVDQAGDEGDKEEQSTSMPLTEDTSVVKGTTTVGNTTVEVESNNNTTATSTVAETTESTIEENIDDKSPAGEADNPTADENSAETNEIVDTTVSANDTESATVSVDPMESDISLEAPANATTTPTAQDN